MEESPQGKKKQSNKRTPKNSRNKNKDIIVFFDDDENKQLTPYEIDFLKNVTQAEENEMLYSQSPTYDHDIDVIFTENSFPRALNKSDRKKLKRKMIQGHITDNLPSPKNNKNSPKNTFSSKSTKKTQAIENMYMSKFVQAQDPLSQLKQTDENEFKIIYMSDLKDEEKQTSSNVTNEMEKLSLTENVDDTKEKNLNDRNNLLFNVKHINFSNILDKALEEAKLNQPISPKQNIEIVFDDEDEVENILIDQPLLEVEFDQPVLEDIPTHDDCSNLENTFDHGDDTNHAESSKDSDESLSYDDVENIDDDDILDEEEENLLYEFYLEHGSDNISDSSGDVPLFDESDSEDSEEDESNSEKKKYHQILNGSFSDNHKKNSPSNSKGFDRVKSPKSRKIRKELKRKQRQGKDFERKDLFRFNENFRKFISTSMVGDSKPIAQVTKKQRRQILQLASIYGLEVTSIGSKSDRIIAIQKSKTTKLIDLVESKKFVRKMMQDPKMKDPEAQEKEIVRAKKQSKFRIDNKIVGEHSKPISDDNLGHMLLKKIGWSGGGLGANEQGNQENIKVLIKTNKKGLGY